MNPVVVTSVPVVAVTVLEDRASVTRRGTVAVVAGQQRVVIERVAAVLADKTLTAVATGARVLDVRCERYAAPWRTDDVSSASGAADGAVASLRAEREALEAKRADADARASAARTESAALARLVAASLADLAVAATRGSAEAGALGQLDELDDQDRAARARAAEAEVDAELLASALARLELRVARAEGEIGLTAARLVIDVVADTAGDATITVGYLVPGAAWRPYHRAVLTREPARVEWETTACVWQSTGEDWPDAALTFSLERASLGVQPPDLRDDELRTRRRPDTVTVEARDHEQQTTGLGGGAAEVPGIDDGGLGLILAGASPITVRCDGRPHRVPIGRFAAAAQLALVAIPLKSAWVHVRARLANAGPSPLLAGPVDLVLASGYVGRGEIGFVGANERIDLGFGPDADVRVHRTETRSREEAGLLGGWNVQTVRVAVRVSNLGAAARQVTITERVPVSEVEQVEVVTSPASAYTLDEPEPSPPTTCSIDSKGLATWIVELPARGRRAVTLEYRIKSKPGVAGV